MGPAGGPPYSYGQTPEITSPIDPSSICGSFHRAEMNAWGFGTHGAPGLQKYHTTGISIIGEVLNRMVDE
jgi:hypothetical protein